MISLKNIQRGKRWIYFLMLTSLALLSGCNLRPDPAKALSSRAEALQRPTATAPASPTPFKPLPSLTPTATRLPTAPPPTPTPEPLSVFQSTMLYKNVFPVEYLEDTCQYLYSRWDPGNAEPGTIVVPVMYHGVRREGGSVADNITVTEKYFKETMARAKELGFETITTQQLENFLQHNAYIPPRSLLLIIDDRRLGTVREHFLPILEANDWTLTMAYITGVINKQEWQQVKDVLATGLVEIQAHGYLHNGETYFYDYTPEETILSEIYEPIKAFKENLGYRPTAFIWPGGDFTDKSVPVVREAGYQLGFTAFPRGPIMFNWVPQGEPERALNDPLLLLPRYWSTTTYKNLGDAVEIGKAAAAFAEGQRLSELSWYSTYCTDYPVIPRPAEEECEICSK